MADITNIVSPVGKVSTAAPTYTAGDVAGISLDTGGAVRVSLAASPTIDIGDVTLLAGSAIVGKVGIDQTTPGTTNAVAVITGQNGVAGGAGPVSATTQRVVIATDQTSIPVSQGASATGGYSFLNIAAGQATTTVKSGAGTLHAIVLNSAATATNTTTIYDNTAASGTVIGRPAVTTATVPTTLIYDLAFATGLTIITATANGGDMTVMYK